MQHPEPGADGGSRLCDGLDLAQDALGQVLDGDAAAGGLGGEELGVDLVERRKIRDVGQEAGGLDHFVKAAAAGFQNGADVLQLCSACAAMPSGMVPSAGFTGFWPEV